MSGAREDILRRVRTALADAPAADPPVERGYSRRSELSREERVELLAERLAGYDANVTRARPGEIAVRAGEICARHEVGLLAVPPDLPDAWAPAGLDRLVDRGLGLERLDEADGVLTGCSLAIAETGTIALDGGPRQGRRALSLIPDLHVCVVEADQVRGSVPEAMAALEPAARSGMPVTLISGPSATSDIELSRVQGVHGPRRLEVLLIQP